MRTFSVDVSLHVGFGGLNQLVLADHAQESNLVTGVRHCVHSFTTFTVYKPLRSSVARMISQLDGCRPSRVITLVCRYKQRFGCDLGLHTPLGSHARHSISAAIVIIAIISPPSLSSSRNPG
jgi:hypothetical protein